MTPCVREKETFAADCLTEVAHRPEAQRWSRLVGTAHNSFVNKGATL